MAVFQRFLVLGLIPILAFNALQLFFPDVLLDLQKTLQPYLANTPLGPISSGRLPRSETPLYISVVDHYSHWEKTASVAKALANLGYPITFITGSPAQELTQNLHPKIKYAPLSEQWSQNVAKAFEEMAKFPQFSIEAEVALEKWAFIETMQPGHDVVQQHFREFKDEYGKTKPLIYLTDALFSGHMPILLGATGIKPDSLLTIVPHPHTLDSNDTYPFHIFKVPETGPDAQAIHQKAYRERHTLLERSRITDERFWAKLRSMGSTKDPLPNFFHAMSSDTDHVMKLGVPELEYKRSDLRDNVHYFGALKGKKKEPAKRAQLPSWWDDVLQAKQDGKKIVAVSQGTLAPDLTELLIPTLQALESRDDVLVIASTVLFEPDQVPGGLVVPDNARVAKFVPYTDLLPLADVLVNNAGYGAVMTALSEGIPVVVAGEGQDKEVTSFQVELAGVGVNLKSRRPTMEAVKAGLEKILDDPSFKKNALEIKDRFDSYDMASVFDGVIQGVVQDWATKRKSTL